MSNLIRHAVANSFCSDRLRYIQIRFMLSVSIFSQFSPVISGHDVADIMMDAQGPGADGDHIAVNKGPDKTVLQ